MDVPPLRGLVLVAVLAATDSAGASAQGPTCAVATGVECELPKHADEVAAISIDGCCTSCSNASWCRFWSFKASDVPNGIACRRFNAAPLRNRSSSEFVSGSPPPPTPAPPSDVRLRINGSTVLTPGGEAIRLVGFNWPLVHVHPGDGALMKQRVPGANVARIVGVLWDNSNAQTDCYSDLPPHFFREECFDTLDAAVSAATEAGVWVILAGRFAFAAGQFYDTKPESDVYHNETLRDMAYSMWRHVAGHYASWPFIAAYEVMAEPRDKLATPTQIRDFYAGACAAVEGVDPLTPCMVGPGPYYKLWNFTLAHMRLNTTNVIYTFDYFVPEEWVFGGSIPHYPGVYNCTELYTDVWTPVCCPNGPGASQTFNASWNEANFNRYALPVRSAGVPIFVNQWSVVHGVPAEAGRYKYMSDIAQALQSIGAGWAWWVWRGGGDGWSHVSAPLHCGTRAGSSP